MNNCRSSRRKRVDRWPRQFPRSIKKCLPFSVAEAVSSAPPSPKPTLSRANGEASALYGEVGRADATPTAAQMNAGAETGKTFAAVSKDWKQLVSVDLPALNRQLRDANLPEIHFVSKAPEQDDSDDID